MKRALAKGYCTYLMSTCIIKVVSVPVFLQDGNDIVVSKHSVRYRFLENV